MGPAHGNGRRMGKSDLKTQSIIQCALTLRDGGVDGKKIIRTCLFIAVLIGIDESIDIKKMLSLLETIDTKTKKALNTFHHLDYMHDIVGEA